MEREGDRTLYWYDGVPYGSLEEIPDPAARTQAEQLLPQIDQAEADLTKGVPKTRIVINGVTYNSLAEITDPTVREAVEEGMKQAAKS